MVEAPDKWTLKLPELYPKQRAAVYAPERISVIEATTKAGKTVGCITWQLDRAWRDDATHLWVAPIFPQAKIAHQRLKRFMVKADPTGDSWDSNQSDLTISFQSGSKIVYRGGDDPDSIYGPDYADAVIDEATRCKEEVWYAVRSTLTATRGPVRIIGNVKGRRNWAYQMARKAEAGSPDMAYFKITAHDAVAAGVLDAQEIEDARTQLPEDVFKELYLAIPSDDGGNPFGLKQIRDCIIPQLAPGPVAYWGIDLARSHDWTVAIGLNARGQVCAFKRWQSDWRNTGLTLQAMVKDTPGNIDATGVGSGCAEEVARHCPNLEQVNITQPMKQELMGLLKYAIHNRFIGYPDGPIVSELETFEYEIKVIDGRVTNIIWSAPPGMFDDCVLSLALANRCRVVSPAPSRLTVVGVDDQKDTYATGYNRLEDEDLWQPM